MRFFKKRKSRLVREDTQPRRIQVQPKRTKVRHDIPQATHKKSPPPDYNEAIKTISNAQAGTSNGIKGNQIESYRTFNGRTYAVVKVDGGTQLVPMRAPSAAIFNYQYAYSNYN